MHKYSYGFIKNFNKFNDELIKVIEEIEIKKVKEFKSIFSIAEDACYNYLKSVNDFIDYSNNKKIVKKVHQKLVSCEIEKIKSNNETILTETLRELKVYYGKTYYGMPKLKKTILENKRSLNVLANMIYSYSDFILDIDYKKYPSIDYSNLELGDIILSVKKDKIIHKNFIFKLTYYITKSHIGHASIFYEKKNEKYYFIDTPSRFVNVYFKKYRMRYSQNVVGLVLRKREGLNIYEKNKIDKYLRGVIGKKLGLYKGLFLAFLLAIYEKLPFYKNLKNPFSKKTIFCSENVVRAYEAADICLSNKYDEATITPIDLLNSKRLEIIGYIDRK